MDAKDPRPEQTRTVIDGTAPILDYLTKLAARMDALASKPNDPAYLAAIGARDALRELQAALRKRRRPSCHGGRGATGTGPR